MEAGGESRRCGRVQGEMGMLRDEEARMKRSVKAPSSVGVLDRHWSLLESTPDSLWRNRDEIWHVERIELCNRRR